MTSLATIIGPLLGGLLYVHLGHAIPYWSAALIIILVIGAVLLSLHVRQQTQTVQTTEA